MKTYYNKHTKNALKNFSFSYPNAHKELTYATAIIKQATAQAHKTINEMPEPIADAIIKACQEVQQGKFDNQFTLPGLQGGAGTSLHMNANEVIAARAMELLKNAHTVHPNDHVNKSQSTNDVGPSALKIACMPLINQLSETLLYTKDSFLKKAKEYKTIEKLGRTHLQDAVPTSIEEEFTSYAMIIARGQQKLEQIKPYFYELNLGGTAIGNAINASPAYQKAVYKALQEITTLPFVPAKNLMAQTSSQTDFVSLSQVITAIMIDLSKIANDLRLLSSGPHGGFGEIRLQELQAGSSIMPGKVNPILPETVNQTYFLVSGNNLSIEHAAQAAQLELGVMFPLIADKLLTSVKLTNEVLRIFSDNCVRTLTVNEENCRKNLEQSTAYATILNPILGYETVSAMVKEARKTGDMTPLKEALQKYK